MSLVVVTMMAVVVGEAMVWLSVMLWSTVMRRWGSLRLVHTTSTVVMAVWAVMHVGWWWAVDRMVRTSTHHTLTHVTAVSFHALESALEAVELGGNNGTPFAQQRPLVAILWKSMVSVWSVHGSLDLEERQLSLEVLESVNRDFGNIDWLTLESAELDSDAQDLVPGVNSVGSAGPEGPACQAKRIGGVLRRVVFDIHKRGGCRNLSDIWSLRFGL